MKMSVPDDFLDFEAKVNELVSIIKDENPLPLPHAKKDESVYDIDLENLRLQVTQERSLLNRKVLQDDKGTNGCAQMDAATFMKQTEEDANKRAHERKLREAQSELFTKRATEAFRKKNYEEAALLYTQAIEKVKDNASSHTNRALCYYYLKNYTRCLADCDFVRDKLHDNNIRSLLYRAACCYRLKDMQGFEETVQLAREHHPKKTEYIEKYCEKIKSGDF